MEPRDLIGQFHVILARLMAATGAGRCTVRLDLPGWGWSVNTPVAEVLAPGMRSMSGDGSIDHRRARSIRWIEANRQTLVQGDVFADPGMAPPPALSQVFGTRAQMVAPLMGEDGYLVGWLSAHFTDGPRDFDAAVRSAMTREQAAVCALLGFPAPLA